MSIDPTEELIQSFAVQLSKVTGEDWEKADRWKFGAVEKAHQGSFPRVEWEEQGGNVTQEGRLNTGGPRGDVFLDTERFQITIWHKDRDNCKRIMRELMRIVRKCPGIAAAPGPWEYQWIEDANTRAGRKLQIIVAFNTKVLEVEGGVTEREVKGHHSTINGVQFF